VFIVEFKEIGLLYRSETTTRFNLVPMVPTRVVRFDVLVVEDDLEQLSLLTEILAMGGYSVHGVSTAAEAIAILNSARVDLLVADIRLGDEMNGFELADLAQSIRPSLQVLFITGFTIGLASRQRAARPDAKILHKPFALDDLVNAADEFLSGPVIVRTAVS
jgi:DNA-binding NtrC family response regulator